MLNILRGRIWDTQPSFDNVVWKILASNYGPASHYIGVLEHILKLANIARKAILPQNFARLNRKPTDFLFIGLLVLLQKMVGQQP